MSVPAGAGPDGADETALLLPVPRAEPAVARHRLQLDSAAADGIPAHVTVLYPFVPLTALREADHSRLHALFAASHPVSFVSRRTAWFDERVLFMELEDPGPVRELTERVVEAFPGCPPYAGTIPTQDVLPHLTVGHDRSLAELRTAERGVRKNLPVEDHLDHVELWSGPGVAGRSLPSPWRKIRSYRLGHGAGPE